MDSNDLDLTDAIEVLLDMDIPYKLKVIHDMDYIQTANVGTCIIGITHDSPGLEVKDDRLKILLMDTNQVKPSCLLYPSSKDEIANTFKFLSSLSEYPSEEQIIEFCNPKTVRYV